MIADRYKDLSAQEFAQAGFDAGHEMLQQPIEEYAYAMIFQSVGLMSDSQKRDVLNRNLKHLQQNAEKIRPARHLRRT